MPRRRQVSDPDAIYHLTFRAPAKRLLFRDGEDRERYLRLFGAEVLKRGWTVFTYCLLGTHGHSLLRARDLDLGDGLQIVHETYAVEFNRRWGEHGTLFSNGPSYTRIRSDDHLLGTLRYVARNPVAAGLCKRPSDWPWSAHAALLGVVPPPEFLAVDAVALALGSRTVARYASLTALDDRELLAELRAGHPDTWLLEAIGGLALSARDVAAALGLSERAVYSRLATQRRNHHPSQKGRALQ